MLVPFVLPRLTVLTALPVPMAIVCSPSPPIVTAPDDVPVPMPMDPVFVPEPIVVRPEPALLISTLPLFDSTICVAAPVLNVSVPVGPVRTKRVEVIAFSPSVS